MEGIANINDLINYQLKQNENGFVSCGETGFRNVDSGIIGKGGLREKEITVITGTPSSGKTQFVNNIALHNLSRNRKVFICSIEFEYNDVIRMLAEQITGIDLEDYDANVIEWLPKAYSWLQGKGLHVYKDAFIGGQLSIKKIVSKMREVHEKEGVRLFIIDPITALLTGNNDTSAIEIMNMINELKVFTKQTKTHVITVMHPRKLENDWDVARASHLYGSTMLHNFVNNLYSLWRYRNNPRDKVSYTKDYKTSTFIYCLKNRKQGQLMDNKECLLFEPKTKRFREGKSFRVTDELFDVTETSRPLFIHDFDFKQFNDYFSEKSTKEAIESTRRSEQ